MSSVIQDFLNELTNYLSGQSFSIQLISWLVIILLLIVAFYLLISLLFFPFMYLFNRLTDKNKSNPLSKKDVLLGKLTLKIHGDSIGEVMEIGSKEARSTYPAKFFREKDRLSGLKLEKGTNVIIIEFDDQGIALVIENKNG